MVRPGATGYSPFAMCTSVPQIVVVVMRTRASVGPTAGIGFSTSSRRPGATKTVAFIVVFMVGIASAPALSRSVNRRGFRARCPAKPSQTGARRGGAETFVPPMSLQAAIVRLLSCHLGRETMLRLPSLVAALTVLAAACTPPAPSTPRDAAAAAARVRTPAAGTGVVPGTSAAELAVGTSALLFGTAPLVVLADTRDLDGQARGAAAAVALGVPLLLTPSPERPAAPRRPPHVTRPAATRSPPS